jgi:hypothetical protein
MAQDKSDVVGESLLFVVAGITCRSGCTGFDLTRAGCEVLAHSSIDRLHCCTAVSTCVEMFSVNGEMCARCLVALPRPLLCRSGRIRVALLLAHWP